MANGRHSTNIFQSSLPFTAKPLAVGPALTNTVRQAGSPSMVLSWSMEPPLPWLKPWLSTLWTQGNHSVPQFCHLWNGDDSSSIQQVFPSASTMCYSLFQARGNPQWPKSKHLHPLIVRIKRNNAYEELSLGHREDSIPHHSYALKLFKYSFLPDKCICFSSPNWLLQS